jgi:hypothetical protein
MTQRAFEREQYKKKKRLPAPEVPKPKNHHKPPKKWLMQNRYTTEAWEKWKTCWSCTVWHKENKWETVGKYYDYETAEIAMKSDKRKYPEFKKQYEYRIVEKGKEDEWDGKIL